NPLRAYPVASLTLSLRLPCRFAYPVASLTLPPLRPAAPVRRDDAGCDSRVSGHGCSGNSALPGKILPLAPRPDNTPGVLLPDSTLRARTPLEPAVTPAARRRPGWGARPAHCSR